MKRTKKIKLLLAEDNIFYRESFKEAIKFFKDLELIGIFSNGSDLINKFPDNKPDIILLDYNFTDMNGYECAEKLSLLDSKVKIIIISISDILPNIDRLKNFGIKDFYSKNDPINILVDKIKIVYEGNV
jgi:DNA-binding NarL/FixJ family response regulator